ncbi:MAG: DUF4166 domain-containing protein [Woeseiaceae bacterium]
MSHNVGQDAKRVLIIGGYGTFGGWVARLLAPDSRLELMIAGRSLEKAQEFALQYPQQAAMTAVRFDRDDDVEAQIRASGADIVVDASGPFQAYGSDAYRVAKAAIACNANYLDLADASKFVVGIEALNRDACLHNVFALSGVSTCVALSSAVLRSLSEDLQQIDSFRGGIAPSPYSGVGASVMQAVALSAGKPTNALIDRKVQEVFPFTDAKRITIAPPGCMPLYPRVFSLVDVPDLLTAQGVEPSVRNVWFGAAPVPGLYHAVLRALARVVKRGWLPSLEFLAPIMFRVMRNLAWGEHRGGMFIEIEGHKNDGSHVTRSWHLIAEGDHGPAIPAMASAAIISQCLDGVLPQPGARPATNELTIDAFQPFFQRMNISTGEKFMGDMQGWPIFRRVLGNAWEQLPNEIMALHDVSGSRTFNGRAEVTRGSSFLAKIVGRIVGFPPAGVDIPLTVKMRSDGEHERWTRDFDGHKFASVMAAGTGRTSDLICERFGPAKFAIALVLENDCLKYVPRSWRLLGIPMPLSLAPQGKMLEYVEDSRFHFHVEIKLPIIGNIVTYQGWLEG